MFWCGEGKVCGLVSESRYIPEEGHRRATRFWWRGWLKIIKRASPVNVYLASANLPRERSGLYAWLGQIWTGFTETGRSGIGTLPWYVWSITALFGSFTLMAWAGVVGEKIGDWRIQRPGVVCASTIDGGIHRRNGGNLPRPLTLAPRPTTSQLRPQAQRRRTCYRRTYPHPQPNFNTEKRLQLM